MGAFKRDRNWALKCTNFIFSSISAEDTDKMEKEMNLFETEAQRQREGETGGVDGDEKRHKKLMVF